jgi:hypothetical protein
MKTLLESDKLAIFSFKNNLASLLEMLLQLMFKFTLIKDLNNGSLLNDTRVYILP